MIIKSDDKQKIEYAKQTFGRKQICTKEKVITQNNIAKILTEIYPEWLKVKGEICYLYDYYKGKQPSLYRTKEIRSDICNQIVENRAKEIVDFKTGYICGSPIQYVCRNSDVTKSEEIDRLNSYMLSENKHSLDKEIFEWQYICGTAYRMCRPDNMAEKDDCPFEIHVLDPRKTFVIYSDDYRKKALAGVYHTVDTIPEVTNKGKKTTREQNTYEVYTEFEYIKVVDDKVVEVVPHIVGRVPIIEYPANESKLGAFEPVLPLLDALNTLDCNRLDGVEQFIQSLIILYNCQLPEGEDATSLQTKGLIELKSTGENKADIKILSEQLNQTETQTLKADLLSAIREISGVPAQGDGNSSDSSNNGAVVLKNGWQSCESMAKSSELMFKKAETEFIKLAIDICNKSSVETFTISLLDIETKFTRNCYDNILSKSQTLVTLLQTEKVAPQIAFDVCGLFSDSEEAYLLSKKYVEEQKENEPLKEISFSVTEGMTNEEADEQAAD